MFHYRQFPPGLTAERSRIELSKQLDFTMPRCYCYFRYCSCNCSRGAGLNLFLGNSNYLPEYIAQNLHGCYLLSSDTEEPSQPTSLYKALNGSIYFSTFLCYLFPPSLPVFKEMLTCLSPVLHLSHTIVSLLCFFSPYYYVSIVTLIDQKH